MSEAAGQTVETHTPEELARPTYVLNNHPSGRITEQVSSTNNHQLPHRSVFNRSFEISHSCIIVIYYGYEFPAIVPQSLLSHDFSAISTDGWR